MGRTWSRSEKDQSGSCRIDIWLTEPNSHPSFQEGKETRGTKRAPPTDCVKGIRTNKIRELRGETQLSSVHAVRRDVRHRVPD